MAELEQFAQFSTHDGVVCVYLNRSSQQVILERNGEWTIQDDGYITDSLAEVLAIKGSTIHVRQLSMCNMYDPASSFEHLDDEMVNHFYNCKWSDYTCDYLLLQGDLSYPLYD